MNDVRNLKKPYDSLDAKQEITHAQRLVELLAELRARPVRVKNPNQKFHKIDDYLPDPVRTAIIKEVVGLGEYLYETGGHPVMASVFDEVEIADEKLAWDLDRKWSGIGIWLA